MKAFGPRKMKSRIGCWGGEGHPTVLGCRLPMETTYRDFWQLPYPEGVRFRLMATFLQAKAVLAWLRALAESGTPLDAVVPLPRAGAEARLPSIGLGGLEMQQRARDVAAAIYKVVGAVIAPGLDQLPAEAREEYAPFDVVEAFRVPTPPDSKGELLLQPLAILDDAHALHPDQYDLVKRWLARGSYDSRGGCWRVLTRSSPKRPWGRKGRPTSGDRRARRPPETSLKFASRVSDPMRTAPFSGGLLRDGQGHGRPLPEPNAAIQRPKDNHHSGHFERGNPRPPPASHGRTSSGSGLRQTELGITAERRAALEAAVRRYAATRPQVGEDVQAAMLMILMRRHWNAHGRSHPVPGGRPGPFPPGNPEQRGGRVVQLHLLHGFGRPFYFGPDDLCDASSENAEQFLHLAAVLVDAAANQLSRSQRRTLTAARQNELLRQRAEELLREKNFPYHAQVKGLAHAIGIRCRQETLEQNGWLRPNAYGVVQTEFSDTVVRDREFAEALQFGMAYNVWSLKQDHSCQGKIWTLVELGGAAILQHGLSLGRGDFVKGTMAELRRWTNEPLKAVGSRG